MPTNIDIHQGWKCEERCGYGMVIGVQSRKFYQRSVRDECPCCGADLECVNSRQSSQTA